ncbi:MAG: hypothetical protein ACJ8AI_23500 [Rhodopila sp.]
MDSAVAFSRRRAIRGITWLTSTILAATAGPVLAREELSKTEAKYQDHPNGQQRCAICLRFRPPGTCRIVAGSISPTGWCQFFAARENAR